MIILTIMVVTFAMQDKTNCYVKVVEENYYDKEDERVIPKIHLIFLSKRDYNRINEIEKMIEKYYMLEEVKGEKEYILYFYLEEIFRYLKECEVMEVLSDHDEAFDLVFHYIRYFMIKSDRMRPRRKLIISDDDEEPFFESSIYPQEKYENEKLKKKDFEGRTFIDG